MHLAKNANLNNSFKQICSDKLESSSNILLHFPITTVVQMFISWDLCLCRPVIKLLVHDQACSHNAFLITSPCPPFDTQAFRVTCHALCHARCHASLLAMYCDSHTTQHSSHCQQQLFTNDQWEILPRLLLEGKGVGHWGYLNVNSFIDVSLVIKTKSIFDFLFQRLEQCAT